MIRLIDVDAIVAAGEIIMIVGFFGFMLGLLVMVCGLMMWEVL